MDKFYFTYGMKGHPFVGGWTEVEAENYDLACKAFRAYHPDVIPGLLNCSSVYPSLTFAFTTMAERGNLGSFCHEKITLHCEKTKGEK